MCSRYTFRATIPELKTLLDDAQRHNIPIHEGDIHPNDLTLGLILQGGVKKTVLMRWGYPSTTHSGLIINARSETIQNKPIFSSDFKYRRCLLPMAGFYEWDFKKNLYLFSPKVADAYLCGIFHHADNDFFHFVVLTRPAAGTPASVHHRMPIILSNAQTDQWLSNLNAAHRLLYGEPYLLEKNALKNTNNSIFYLNAIGNPSIAGVRLLTNPGQGADKNTRTPAPLRAGILSFHQIKKGNPH